MPVPENSYENYLLLTVGAVGIAAVILGVFMIPVLPFAAVFALGIGIMQFIGMYIAGAPNQLSRFVGKLWRNLIFIVLGGIWELFHTKEQDILDSLLSIRA